MSKTKDFNSNNYLSGFTFLLQNLFKKIIQNNINKIVLNPKQVNYIEYYSVKVKKGYGTRQILSVTSG